MKAAEAGKQEILEVTVSFWTPRRGAPVSHEDARQIMLNVAGFFRVLGEWDRRARETGQTPKDDEVMP